MAQTNEEDTCLYCGHDDCSCDGCDSCCFCGDTGDPHEGCLRHHSIAVETKETLNGVNMCQAEIDAQTIADLKEENTELIKVHCDVRDYGLRGTIKYIKELEEENELLKIGCDELGDLYKLIGEKVGNTNLPRFLNQVSIELDRLIEMAGVKKI